ncbi:MAG TPA: dienelactone hydrolase family protein [Candidatus Sulfotelmatobacter sp.]|nr:dienelactone hydrolase family protein [Candidatus Sulfotelmatobacter sp.]
MHSPEQPKPFTTRTEIHSFETVTFSDKSFLVGAHGPSARIAGELRLPGDLERYPVVILIHGSGGITANVDRWARELHAIGVAAFLVDCFTGRGIAETVTDQTRLGSLTMVFDAYRALDYLAQHRNIDAKRIALMGFSKGGSATLYASLTRFQKMYGPQKASFTAYMPFYPPCGTKYLEDESTVDAPIRIFHGSADNYVPVDPCRKYVARLRAAGRNVELIEFPGAHHVFDNPLYMPHVHPPDPKVAGFCEREERTPGEIVNVATGKPFTWSDPCVRHEATVGYDAAATRQATELLTNFIAITFGLELKHARHGPGKRRTNLQESA